MTDKDYSEELGDLIHKLNHNLTLVYGYIDISIQNLKSGKMTKKDIINFLNEAKKTYDEVKDIIEKIANQVGGYKSKNE